MPATASQPTRSWLTFRLATALVLMIAGPLLFGALKRAEDFGPLPAAAVCIAAGTLIGLIELRGHGGFGALRGRPFHGTVGGMGGGSVYAFVTITLEWLALGHAPGEWTAMLLRLGLWLLWGGLAGGVLGGIADALVPRKRAVVRAPADPRAGEFLARLDEGPPSQP